MGLSDHMTIDIKISCKPILIKCLPRENYFGTKWDNYTKEFSDIPLINLEGKFISDINKEINNIYEKMNESKSNTTPIVTFRRIRTSKSSLKFKRLT